MSKKSGFFYSLLAMIGLLSMTTSMRDAKSMKFQPTAPTGGGGGTGKTIRSYGRKPDYGHLPRKKFYQEKIDARKREHEANVWELNQEGIIWTPVGLFWKTRKLAEMN
jgi:hypothetical protein